MSSDRWQVIETIYHSALEQSGSERTAFIREACAGDDALQQEVESLLAYDTVAAPFIDKHVLQVAAQGLAGDLARSMVGRQIGAYKIVSLLGIGGMGEVYRAVDSRLNRTVAIKVLPRHLSERADLRQRFEREAKAIASMNHPHICTVHDVGQEGVIDFLVMEYLEGVTLSQRLKKGPLPTADVLRHAFEISRALDQAHRKGVVHRDLKPGNIMLTETGAKLLDFGLAKRTGGAGALRTLVDARGSARPTESLTEQGMLLGTIEYMAPEQLEGKEADARTDIFALGVVIYEMATGRKAFEGDSKVSLIAKILTAQPPPITSIEPVSPPELDILVQKCLAKKPEERWQSAADLTSALQEIAEANLEILKAQKRGTGEAKEIESELGPAVPVLIPEPTNVLSRLIRSRAWKLGFVGILLAAITGSLVLWRVRQQPQKPPEKKEMSFKPLTSYSWDNPLDFAAISPDGKYLAFCSNGKLSIQIIGSGEKRSIAIPEWFYPTRVSWFPHGTKLLLSRAEEKWIEVKGEKTRQSVSSLWSLSILGGTPQKVVENAFYPSVSPDGSLVAFTRFDPERQTHDFWVVGANGEGPRRIGAPSQLNQFYFGPVWSSNGQRLFYVRYGVKDRAIESFDIRGEKVTTIFSSKFDFHSLCWIPDGRILFSMKETHRFNLWEIKVDAATGQPLSEARSLTQWSGFSFTNVGNLSITADGKQLALLRGNAQGDIYVAEAEAGGKAMKTPRRLTLDETDDSMGDWTADSRAVLFVSYRNENGGIFKQDINQTEAEAIVTGPEEKGHPNLSPDRAFILYLVSEKREEPATRLMRVPVGGGPPELVLTGEKIKNFSCAREAKLCVVVEEVDGKQILTTFDPVKGRGEKLPLSDFSDYGGGVLSPQGRLIEKMKPGPDGLHIRVRSLTGGPTEEITFKDLTGDYNFHGWSLDGKGIYIEIKERTASYYSVLYAGLDGHSQVLWKRGTSPGYTFDPPIPSPDGRHLAFTVVTYEANAWLLENF